MPQPSSQQPSSQQPSSQQPQPLDVLRFPLHGNRLIEASAGTGKTYTLALLYTRLVLGHGNDGAAFERPLMPPEILVMTFTDAATKELRERIRTRLVEVAELFDRAPPPARPAAKLEAELGAEFDAELGVEPDADLGAVLELTPEIAPEIASCVEPDMERPGSGSADSAVTDDALSALRDSYAASQWPGCARRLRQAAEWMDEAMILTIHGWCQRMLQEHAFSTRGLFQRELVTDQTDLIAELLRDYWRIHFYALPADQAACIQSIMASPAVLQERLAQWLDRRDAVLSYRGQPLSCHDLAEPLAAQCRWQNEAEAVAEQRLAIEAECRRLEDLAREQWCADRAAIEAHLRELRRHLKGPQHASTRPEDFDQLLAEIAAWAEAGAAPPGKLKNFGQGAFAFKKSAKIQAEATHPAFAALAAWQEVLSQTKPTPPEPPEPSLEACLLAHAAAWVGRELPRRLRVRAEMGFDDLLRELEAALRPADDSPAARAQSEQLAATIRSQFPVALIDEFQDTDPIQYRIFASIYGAGRPSGDSAVPATALVMIGDPKQAIYGFRGADIQAYLDARRATAGRHYSLGRNFRSTEAMVAACNRLFGYADRHAQGAFRFRELAGIESIGQPKPAPQGENPVPFLEVSAKGRDEQLIIGGEPAAAMTFWQLDSGDAPIGASDYRAQMAEAAASEILRWLQQARAGHTGLRSAQGLAPLRPKDIAILVRSSTEARVMREALAARRIHSVYLSDRDSVFETEEAGDLLHWLRACAEPTDEALVRAALGSNTLGLPLQALAVLQQDELAWEAEIERFRVYRRIWQRQGVLALLRQLMHEADLPARLLARGNGERILTNLLHLSEWLQQAAITLDGEQALIRHLRAHLEQRGQEFIVRLESDAELVQVITIHKSKGLEYPLVLLPFICSWRSVDGRSKQVPYRMTSAEGASSTARPALQRDCSGNAASIGAAAGQSASSLGDQGASSAGSQGARSPDDQGASSPPGLSALPDPITSSAAGPPSRYLEVAGHRLFKDAWIAADEERLSEDLRLLYVAVTRARYAVVLGIAALKSGNAKQPQLERSAIGYVLGGGSTFPRPQAVWDALAQLKGDCAAIAIRPAPSIQQGWLAAETETSLAPARAATHARFTPWWISSYSALRQGASAPLADASELSLQDSAADTATQEITREEGMLNAAAAGAETRGQWLAKPPEGLLHGFPRGSRYGTFLHGLLEWAGTQQWQQDGALYQGYAAAVEGATQRRDMLARRCALRGLVQWIDRLDDWLLNCLAQRWMLSGLSDGPSAAPTLALQDLSPRQIQVEMEFWIESKQVDTARLDALVQTHCLPGETRPELRANRLNGMLKGFIDLVFEHQGRYYLLDWKSNWLGPDDDAYTPEIMTAAVLEHRYDLQYTLYLLALHRLLRARLPGYEYERHIGGVIYVFLRGTQAPSQGLFTDKPAPALIEALDQLFAGEATTASQEVA
ncbi:exodeoxyribonuclease V subunit beta [Halochromatium sp.]